MPRPVWLRFATLMMAIARVVLAMTSGPVGLYVGVVLVGCSFGCMFTLNVVVTSETWVLRHHGANYMLFDGVTGVIGTLGMAKYLKEVIYNRSILHGQD